MMRADYDAATKWTPVPDWPNALLARESWSARPLPGLHRMLLSGDLDKAQALLPEPAAEAGLWRIAPETTVLLRLGRDRALLVGESPIPLAPGWHADGFAVSEASDAFAGFELSGPGMAALVREAVAADLDADSPSAATLFAGVFAILHRTAPETARLHVESPLGAYVWRWLEMRISAGPD